ncbi:hypothetical protein KSP40_PGU015235 [Platanthera guangdongensis]|uniref:Uncharacterized protein n=1 Tax=Platanthera guangdongensis TaxID=2320717 RepID=A0ABR2M3M8_9ASPA
MPLVRCNYGDDDGECDRAGSFAFKSSIPQPGHLRSLIPQPISAGVAERSIKAFLVRRLEFRGEQLGFPSSLFVTELRRSFIVGLCCRLVTRSIELTPDPCGGIHCNNASACSYIAFEIRFKVEDGDSAKAWDFEPDLCLCELHVEFLSCCAVESEDSAKAWDCDPDIVFFLRRRVIRPQLGVPHFNPDFYPPGFGEPATVPGFPVDPPGSPVFGRFMGNPVLVHGPDRIGARSFDEPSNVPPSNKSETELMEEEHACQSLLIIFSRAAGVRESQGFQSPSLEDMENYGLFQWEMGHCWLQKHV